MAELQLEDSENIIGSWSVYTGSQGVNTAKTTGKLFVTDRNLYFTGGLALADHAAGQISERTKAFDVSGERLKVPLTEIAGLKIVKKFLILKSLQVSLRSGEQIEFHFGAASPQKACEAIKSRTGLMVA